MREKMDLARLMPTMLEVISAGGVFRLYPRGTSMLPLLHEGSDSVELIKPDGCQVGDVLLYRRANGQFVLHRLIAADRDSLTFCGDNQTLLEYDVPKSAVLAKMSGYYTGDEHRALDTPEYRRYAKERVRRFPFYRRNKRIYCFLREIKHKIIK